jgi:hypothetical protein
VFLKGGGFTTGVLYSPRTRKAGLITYNDIKKIILAVFKPDADYTATLRIKHGNWHNVLKQRDSLVRNFLMRWPILTGYGYIAFGIILFWLYSVFFRDFKMLKAITLGYLYILTIPAVFLIVAIFDPVDWITINIYTLGISGAFFAIAYFGSSNNLELIFVRIATITVALVLINSFFNGLYEFKSFLGYSVVAGGRYYGIGNEYMGILLGAYIVGVTLTIQYWKLNHRYLLWIASFFIGLILIHPRMGADVGGGITAILGLGITNYLWQNRRIGIRQILYLFTLCVIALAFAGLFDIYAGREEMSHWGELWMAVGNQGIQPLTRMIGRKLAMNYRLIHSNPLTIILILFILTIPVFLLYPPLRFKEMITSHINKASGLAGICITALLGLLVNDSGIASAAMIFMFGLGMVFLGVYDETAKYRNLTKNSI